jgi:hypothetical protein
MNGYRGIWDFLFGCWHSHLSFPHSDKHHWSRASARTGMYVVCLDCGRQFAYDWEEMRVLGKREKTSAKPVWELGQRGAH